MRAFLAEGYAALGNVEGDMSARGPLFHLSWDDFVIDSLPTLGPADSVVLVDGVGGGLSPAARSVVLDLCQKVQSCGASIIHVLIGDASDDLKSLSLSGVNPAVRLEVHLDSVALTLPGLPLANCFLGELACKLTLNAITTGAHVLKGKVCAALSFVSDCVYHSVVCVYQCVIPPPPQLTD